MLKLRPTQVSDLPTLFAFQANEDYNQMAAFTAKNYQDQAAYLQKWTELLEQQKAITYTIWLGDRIIGSVLCFEMMGEWNVGYGIGKPHWGQGIATEALRAFLQLVSQRPLYGRVVADNIGSIRVLEKCGFQKIATEQGFANARGKEVEEFVFLLEK